MKRIIMIMTVLAAISAFAAYDVFSLPNGEKKITVDTAKAAAMKLKELDIWSTIPAATVTVDCIRSITLYTNSYDITYHYTTNGIDVNVSKFGYMTDRGCPLTESEYVDGYSPHYSYHCAKHPDEWVWYEIYENFIKGAYCDNSLHNVQRFLEMDGKAYGITKYGVYASEDYEKWENQNSILSNAVSVAFNDDKSVIVIGRNDCIEVRKASGVSIKCVAYGHKPKYKVVYGNGRFVAMDTGITYGSQIFYVSTDDGDTWTAYNHPKPSENWGFQRNLLFYNGLFVLEVTGTSDRFYSKYGALWTSDGINWEGDDGNYFCTYCVGDGALFKHQDAMIYKSVTTPTNYVASAAFPYEMAEGDVDCAMACGNGILAVVVSMGETNGIYYTSNLDLGPSTTWNVQTTYTDGDVVKEIGAAFSNLVFMAGHFLVSNGDTNVLMATNIADLKSVGDGAKHSTEDYWSNQQKSDEEVRFDNHQMTITKIGRYATTNSVKPIVAKVASSTNRVVVGVCENGFLSKTMTNDVFLVRGDVIKTTGIENDTEATRAIFIYEK